MESVLGFQEQERNDVVDSKSHGFKLVPWMSWDEWKFVRGSLFSSSLDSVAFALRRISTWRSRGCLPVAVDVTASIVEIQQKDPFFRNELDETASQSEELLAMLYCMAIVRLVNGVVEKTREKNKISIGEAADAIGIPRMLIDIRHEGSHRDLPSLQLVRLASTKALDWLISYYWEPQEKVIPVQNNKTANLRKEIKSSLREVSLCLKAKQMSKLSSAHVKGKGLKPTELLPARSKFLFLAAGKSSLANSAGSKKLLVKAMKNALRLYSSFSTELVYLLLEYLLNAMETSNLTEQSEDPQFVGSTQNNNTAFDDWKSVVLKLSRKEPELLIILSQAVLEKIETNETMNCKTDDHQSPVDSAKSRRSELLSYLFEWLVENLKTLKPAGSQESAETKASKMEKNLPRPTVLGLLQRCLLASMPSNKQLAASAVTLAQLAGGSSLIQKLKKLALLEQPAVLEANSTSPKDHTFLSQQEYSVLEAKEKLESIKRQQMQRRHEQPDLGMIGTKRRWNVSKSWTPCPIGMLPHTIGFSGKLPALDRVESHGEVVTVSGIKEVSIKESNGKREAEVSTEKMDWTPVKKVAVEAEVRMQNESGSTAQGITGHLMIDGVWKKVEEGELFDIAAAIRLII
ncbi:hypothetical protein SASPL_149142 [Salvia splendens]|uniref:Ribosomal biogenesis protein LAS1 n=1 Tax=Salvia splendens TaxID=180675 RepID=A0A8X8WAM3_SALSN|nr:uncharacterized protein LOC121780012 [Salvia splendens]KAG6391388.1 hypothetical protein SASPL_149142 [Salvia splendens]